MKKLSRAFPSDSKPLKKVNTSRPAPKPVKRAKKQIKEEMKKVQDVRIETPKLTSDRRLNDSNIRDQLYMGSGKSSNLYSPCIPAVSRHEQRSQRNYRIGSAHMFGDNTLTRNGPMSD